MSVPISEIEPDWRHPPPDHVLQAWAEAEEGETDVNLIREMDLNHRGIPYEKPPEEVWDLWAQWCEEQHGNTICGAWARQKHAPCLLPPNDTGRCKLHGGKNPRGRAHHNYEGKGLSKYIPDDLTERWEETMNDPDLLTLRQEARILYMRLGNMMERLEGSATEDLFRQIRDTYEAAREAQREQDYGTMAERLNELGSLIDEAVETEEVWDEVVDLIENRRKVVEAENRRQVQAEQTYTAEQANLLVQTILNINVTVLSEHGVDEEVFRDLADRIERAVSGRSGRGIQEGG